MSEVPVGTRRAAWWRRPVPVAILLGVLGLLYRSAMTLVQVPEPNSDEAVIGIAAIKIAAGLERPIWFYDQFYMGTFESYLSAPLVLMFGPTMLALRIPLLVLYVIFLVAMWLLTRHVYTPWMATAVTGLLALGSEKMLHNQLVAQGGYPEQNPAGAILILIPILIGLRVVKHRFIWYGVWGFTAGLMVWVTWLVAPYLLVGGVLLLVALWYDGLRWFRLVLAMAVTTVSAMVGAIPFLYYNLFLKERGYGSISVFLRLNEANGNASLSERIYGGGVVGIPMGTGMCVPNHCEDWQLWYGALYLTLILASGVMAAVAWWRVRSSGLTGVEARDERLRQLARLGLVLAALATIASYVRSPSAGWWYNETARYLACLVISTPALIWPLWSLVTKASRRWLRAVGVAGLATITTLATIATVAVFVELPALRRLGQQQDQLIAALDARGITSVYSEYWTCNIMTYKSDERIVCVVLDGEFALGRNRYGPYINVVEKDPRPAYVVPHEVYGGGGRSDAVDKRLAELGMKSEMFTVAGFDVYLPPAEFTAGIPARKRRS